MELTAGQIRALLKDIWPACRYVWLVDKKFWIPKKSQLVHLVKISRVDNYRYIREARDCDNFSLYLHADIKEKALEYNDKLPIAFGEVMGSEFRGRSMMHAINICLCEEGIFLIEPQDDRIWEAKKENDNVFFIKI